MSLLITGSLIVCQRMDKSLIAKDLLNILHHATVHVHMYPIIFVRLFIEIVEMFNRVLLEHRAFGSHLSHRANMHLFISFILFWKAWCFRATTFMLQGKPFADYVLDGVHSLIISNAKTPNSCLSQRISLIKLLYLIPHDFIISIVCPGCLLTSVVAVFIGRYGIFQILCEL